MSENVQPAYGNAPPGVAFPVADEPNLNELLNEAFVVFKRHFKVILPTTIIYFILVGIASSIPHGIGTVLVVPPLIVGFLAVLLKSVRNEQPQIEDLFSGFSLYVPALTAYLCIAVIVVAGLVLLIVPGVIWALGYSQTLLLLAEERLAAGDRGFSSGLPNAWRTCQRSKAMMMGWKKKLFLFGSVWVLITLAGVLAFGVGVVLTAPYAALCGVLFYERIKAIGPRA